MHDRDAAADACGIERGYHDIFGHWHGVDPETQRRLIEALSVLHGRPATMHRSSSEAHLRTWQGDGARVWGLAVQLYALRSARNWGHGDFTDLATLIGIAARAGAGAIGLNPLHALFPERAEEASPYRPNSRLFLNPLYIDVAAIPECPDLSEWDDDIVAARQPDLIDYRAVGRLKLEVLWATWENFKRTANAERRADLDTYRREGGDSLRRFAIFEVLRALRAPQPWPQWPMPWRRPSRAALDEFRAANRDACEFQEFMQWTADRQLRSCQAEARRLGMSIGLYTDLAVGINPHGADAWADQDVVVPGVSIGAPPDEFNRAGQIWGLAPFNPRTLANDDFAPLRRLMRATMRRAGAVRLDHVLGLKRMFLIPDGGGAGAGAYVRYPFEATLRVIAEESVRAQCIVIGEDLGTVPEGFRETLSHWGLWSYRVMLFEREHDGRFRPPAHYPVEALATFNTHDLATFGGWMQSSDLALKRLLGIDPGEGDDARRHSQYMLRSLLAERGASNGDFAAVAYVLGQAPSRLVMVSLEDVLGFTEQVNVPGTVDERPNWRHKATIPLEELAHAAGWQAVAAAFKAAGRAAA
ncbi:MAG: 4-alpha-glucanotransferase [Proteobacteria bacterium]|nr:4-alpha-glucanotransferase [Pseudomonadota bacterium]